MKQDKNLDIKHKLLEVALDIASEQGWSSLSLSDIAQRAELDLETIYRISDKDGLLDCLESWADLAMSALPLSSEARDKDRLFDTIMRRFEYFETRRSGVIALMKARRKSPRRMARLVRARSISADWILICTGLDQGPRLEQKLRKASLIWILARTERAWRADIHGDFAKTMSVLDQSLTQSEDRLAKLSQKCRKTPNISEPIAAEQTSP